MKLPRILGAFLLVVNCSAYAQNYLEGSRPLKIIVPFGAGSGSDLLARAYSRAIEEIAQINVVVENKPGANGIIGAQAAKSEKPDGYTMFMTNSSTQVLNQHLFAKIPYSPLRDFVPVSGIAKFSLVLNAGPSTKFKNAAELISAIKDNPGKYTYGYGTGSTQLSAEMMVHLSKGKMVAVPYKTMAAATLALASGEIDVLMNDASTAMPYYKSGQARPLATTGRTRMVALPEIATLQEQGLRDYEFTGWYAMYFPAKTSDSIVSKMQDILHKASRTKYVEDALAVNAFEPLEMTGSQINELQRKETEKWGKLIRDMGMQPH